MLLLRSIAHYWQRQKDSEFLIRFIGETEISNTAIIQGDRNEMSTALQIVAIYNQTQIKSNSFAK